MACGSDSQLDEDVEFPCDNIPGPGLAEKIYLFYKKDLVGGLVRKALSGAGSKVLTGLPLKTGAKIYAIMGYKLSNNFTVGFSASNFGNKLPHNLQTIIFDQKETGLIAVDKLVGASGLVAAVRDKDLEGDWRILGIRTGLECSNLSIDKNNENAGAAVLDFTAANERYTPDILRVMTGAVDTTEAYLDNLNKVGAA